MERYSIITEKNPREIVLLRGSGCKWKKCTFCDYHLDYSTDDLANYSLNKGVLNKITGIYRELEIINSGSFVDLDKDTLSYVKTICINKKINKLHLESHYMHRKSFPKYIEEFKAADINLIFKIGVESFDENIRENYLNKGMPSASPMDIARYFQEVNLLVGIKGQTLESILKDIEIGKKYFQRVCLNIMTENSTNIKPNKQLINDFTKVIYPIYKDDDKIDILLVNTDFGVGE